MTTASVKNKAKEQNKQQQKPLTMAEQADLHKLYQESVQNAEFELDFIEATFKEWTKRKPHSMREDFCGTALSSVEWVQRHQKNTAVGVDYEKSVLDWGRENNVTALSAEELSRIELIHDNVLDVNTGKFDLIQAFNFSYWIFKERATMVQYFKGLRESLVDDGMLFLDFFGGSECYQTQKEKRKMDGFKYVWDQAEFNALTNVMQCYIHFHFPDKSKLKRAFSYQWRVWGPTEIREILADAGFSKTGIYRQEFDPKTDEPLDDYIMTDEGEDYACWLGYIVAQK